MTIFMLELLKIIIQFQDTNMKLDVIQCWVMLKLNLMREDGKFLKQVDFE
jgi:hypothetical protein